MRFVVQIEDVIVNDEGSEAVNVWDLQEFNTKKNAKTFALEIAEQIKRHEFPLEVRDKMHSVGICIAQYYSDSKNHMSIRHKNGWIPGALVDVVDIETIPPEVWN